MLRSDANGAATRTARQGVRLADRATKVSLAGLLAAAALSLSVPAQANLLTQSVDFTAAQQSLWGPGALNLGFDYSASTSASLPFDLGSVTFGYSVGASTGQVWGNVNGNLATSYADTVGLGTTTIGLSYSGDTSGGGLHSTIGAHATLTAGVTVGPNFQLNVDKTYTPVLDTQVTASNALDNIVKLTLVDIGVADGGVGLGVSQTDRFTPTGISGTLFYSLEGSGVVDSTNYLVGTNAGLSLPVDLTQAGLWDFWFGDASLNNSFNTSMALDVGLYAETVAGCGTLLLESCTWSQTLLSPTVYTGDAFALNFNAAKLGGFQIRVVPEPSTLALLGIGLLLLGGLGLRRRHTVL